MSVTKPVVLFETMFWAPWDGWQIASRAYARTMEMAGVDVCLVSPVPWYGEPDPGVLAEIGHLVKRPSKWDLYIYSGAFMGPQVMRAPLNTLIRGARPPRVMYTMIERLHIAPELAQLVSKLDGVWLPSRANVEAFNRSGVPAHKTAYMPYPHFNDDPFLAIFGTNRAPGVPRFLWSGTWEPRKRPDYLVRAFLRAFKPGEAKLTVKLGPSQRDALVGFPVGPEVVQIEELQTNPVVSAKGWTSQNFGDHIRILRGKLSASEMVKLHADHDVYVSPSLGEGIDLPAYQSKLAGRRLVATYSGGPEDFIGSRDIRVPVTGTVAPHPTYGWEPGSVQNDYKLDDLADALRKAAEGPLTSRDRDWPIENFRARVVGVKLRKLIDRVINETPASPLRRRV